MKNVLTIVKKEFARFFKDKRMVLTVFLPGLLIFALYSILGAVMNEKNEVPDGFKPYAYFIDMPEEYSAPLAGLVDLCGEALLRRASLSLRNMCTATMARQTKSVFFIILQARTPL